MFAWLSDGLAKNFSFAYKILAKIRIFFYMSLFFLLYFCTVFKINLL